MGWLSDIIINSISRNVISSKKERVIERQNQEILKRQETLLKALGYKTEPYKPPTDYIEKGITIVGKIFVILIGTLIILIMIALKVMSTAHP